MALTYLDRSTDATTVARVLRREGAVAVVGLADTGLVDDISAELRPQLDADGLRSRSAFNGDLTRRYSRILATAPSAAALVEHDMVIGVADEVLLPYAATYQISSLSAIEIMPGENGQALHRDDSLYPIEMAGLQLQIGAMWALSDFTKENGGTRVIPGSHRFLRSWHLPDVSTWDAAEMPKGSVLFYLGSTWHGGGANNSNAPRLGLINSYCLGWLRQESNQYMITPPEIAARYSPRLRALLGYTPHGTGDDRIGTYRGESPAWVDTPPEPSWRVDRGQIGTQTHAVAQRGVGDVVRS